MLTLKRLVVAALILAFVGLPSRAFPTAAVLQTDVRGVGFVSLNINSAGSDNAVTIPYPKYVIRRVTVYNASTSLGASPATLGVFTSTGGGGTTVVTAALLTTLTAATVSVDMTVIPTTTALTAQTLYVRNVLAHGSAATVDVTLDIQPLL